MRTTTKFLAAAALAIVSASSFAAQVEWTGSLSAVKIRYWPNNSGVGLPALHITGTGSICPWVGETGSMVLSTGTTAGADEVRNIFNYLVAAKNAGQTVNITYDNATSNCTIVGVRR